MDIIDDNRQAWDGLVERGDQWTIPVGPDAIVSSIWLDVSCVSIMPKPNLI